MRGQYDSANITPFANTCDFFFFGRNVDRAFQQEFIVEKTTFDALQLDSKLGFFLTRWLNLFISLCIRYLLAGLTTWLTPGHRDNGQRKSSKRHHGNRE